MGIVGTATRGMIAGAAATAAMDLLWYRRYRADDGEDSFSTWEFESSATNYGEDAPAPARVGKLVADKVGVDLPNSAVATTNNVVHWMSGLGWGEAAGVAAAALPVPVLVTGMATGVAAWGTSYAALGAVGIYKPITEYDAETLWKDLSAHLVFGATLGVVLTAVGARRRR